MCFVRTESVTRVAAGLSELNVDSPADQWPSLYLVFFFFLLRIVISELVCGRGNWMLPVQLAAFKISRDLTELMPRRRTLSNESYALHSFFPNNDGDLNNRTVRFTSSSNSFLLSTAPPFLLLLSPETHFKPVIQSNSKWLLKENSSLEERKRCPG